MWKTIISGIRSAGQGEEPSEGVKDKLMKDAANSRKGSQYEQTGAKIGITLGKLADAAVRTTRSLKDTASEAYAEADEQVRRGRYLGLYDTLVEHVNTVPVTAPAEKRLRTSDFELTITRGASEGAGVEHEYTIADERQRIELELSGNYTQEEFASLIGTFRETLYQSTIATNGIASIETSEPMDVPVFSEATRTVVSDTDQIAVILEGEAPKRFRKPGKSFSFRARRQKRSEKSGADGTTEEATNDADSPLLERVKKLAASGHAKGLASYGARQIKDGASEAWRGLRTLTGTVEADTEKSASYGVGGRVVGGYAERAWNETRSGITMIAERVKESYDRIKSRTPLSNTPGLEHAIETTIYHSTTQGGNYTIAERASGFTELRTSSADGQVTTEYAMEWKHGRMTVNGQIQTPAITSPEAGERLTRLHKSAEETMLTLKSNPDYHVTDEPLGDGTLRTVNHEPGATYVELQNDTARIVLDIRREHHE